MDDKNVVDHWNDGGPHGPDPCAEGSPDMDSCACGCSADGYECPDHVAWYEAKYGR